MTVTTATSRFEYSGDGTAGPATITGIKALSASDVKIYWNKASSGSGTPVTVGDTSTVMSASGYLTLNTHFTVQNAGTDSDITITLIVSGWTISSSLAYATSGDKIIVTRQVPYTQLSNYQNNDTFDAETLEQSLDRSTMQSQQLKEESDRQIHFSSSLPDSDFNADSLDGTGFDTVRERASTIDISKANRAQKVLAFDSNGDINITHEFGVWKGNWVAGTSYIERDLVKDAETGAVYICILGHVAGEIFSTDASVSAGKWDTVIDAGGFNVKLTGNVTVDSGETLVTPYKIDLNGYTLTNNGTIFCAEILTGTGTLTGSGSTTQSGPINLTDAGVALTANAVTTTGTQPLTNKSLTAPVLTGSASSAGSILFKEDTDNGTNAVTLKGPASTADVTLTLPSATDTLVARDTTDTLTQKTLTSPDINTPDIDGGSIDACTIGTNSVVTDLRVDNLKMDGNTISSTNTNGPIDYDTNGSGNHVFKVGTTTALTISLSGGNTTITGP